METALSRGEPEIDTEELYGNVVRARLVLNKVAHPVPRTKARRRRAKRRAKERARKEKKMEELEKVGTVGRSPTAAAPPSAGGVGIVGGVDTRTEAQKRFDAMHEEVEAKRLAEEAGKSHRQRLEAFNAKLAALSEFHDLPKLGPG